MRQNTREPGARARDLLDLGLAVDREQAHAERIGARDVALLLDRVAEGDAVRARHRPRAPSRSPATEAVSKQEPSEASSDSTSGAGLAFTA